MVNRIRVGLEGFPGGPGVNTFYSTDLSAMRIALNGLYGAIMAPGIVPSTLTATIAQDGDVINSATGAIEGSWVADPIAIQRSASAAGVSYAAAAGFIIKWSTGTVADGGRVVGRTFIVPASSQMFEDDGTINTGKRDVLQLAVNQFVAAASPGFVVWHRPRLARAATGTLKALPAHAGSLAVVTAGSVSDKMAVLRSRRD